MSGRPEDASTDVAHLPDGVPSPPVVGAMPRCAVRDPFDEVSWCCYLPQGHEGPHRPRLSEEAMKYLLDAESFGEAVFDLADVFGVPVTNNFVTWLRPPTDARRARAVAAGVDPELAGDPVYESGEFTEALIAVLEKFWGPRTIGVPRPENTWGEGDAT